MKNRQNQNPPEAADVVLGALDSFTSTVDELGSSYDSLKDRIADWDMAMSRENAALKESLYETDRLRHFFDSILNSMTDGVIVVDTVGRIALFNRFAGHLTGFSESEVVGTPYMEVFGRGISRRFGPMHTLVEGEDLCLEEKAMPTAAGDTLPVRYSTSKVRDEDGRILGVVETFSDLSGIKRLEEQVQQAKTQEALVEMAGLLAHEIRNPIAGIKGYVELLGECIEGDDHGDMIEAVVESIRRLDRIVEHFHLFTRPMKPCCMPINLLDFIENVFTFFGQSRSMDGIEAVIDLPDDPDAICVKTDPQLLKQALTALLDNAAGAMRSGGRLGLSVIRSAESSSDGKDGIRILVSDTGDGIEADALADVFRPFYTTREKGMGMGLPLARNVIHRLGGTLRLESTPSEGTRATISLPL